MSPDTVTLVIPRGRPFHGVARLVVGGLAARLDFPYEQLEDLQLALGSLLESDVYAPDADVTVEVTVGTGRVELLVGPMGRAALERELRTDSDAIGLGRLLTAVAEDVAVVDTGGESAWLRFGKRAPALGGRA